MGTYVSSPEEQQDYDKDMLEHFASERMKAEMLLDTETREEYEWVLNLYARLEETEHELTKRDERIIDLQDQVEYLEDRYEPLN